MPERPIDHVAIVVADLGDAEKLYRSLGFEVRYRERVADQGVDIVGMRAGDGVRINRSVTVRAHQATHRVAARGYEFIETRHHLKPEFAGRDGASLAKLRADGVQIQELADVSMLFYTGDTDRGILEQNDALYKSDVLMIECSFIADGHQANAAKYRHIHFDDIIEFADRFENRCIVLTHFSRRYSRDEIETTIAKRAPESIRDRLRLAL